MKNNLLKTFVLLTYLFQIVLTPLGSQPNPVEEVPAIVELDAQQNRVIFKLTQLVPYDVFTLTTPNRLIVEIPGAIYKTSSRKDVSSELIRRVRGYQFKETPLISRIVVDLNSSVDYTTNVEGNIVTLILKKSIIQPTEKKESSRPKIQSNTRSAKRDLLLSLPKEQVTLDFEAADIKDVIRLLAETSNVNIIYGPEVSGTISIHLRQVPFDEAFATILNLKGLVTTQLGSNILRVTTPDILVKERQKAVTYTKTIPINYLKASDVSTHVLSVMNSSGRKGSVSVVTESNSLVITDSDEGILQAERLIAQLDVQPKQVMIESRIVEVNLANGLDIGVQWEFGNSYRDGNTDRNVGLISEEGFRVGREATNSSGDDVTIGAATPPGGTGVALPGPASASIAFGIVKAGRIFDISLQALVTQSKAKILSAPKIVTVNGQAAKIEAVQEIRFRTSTVSNGVVTSDFKSVNAGIVLNVTPTINAEDRVTLKISPESSFPTAESTDAGPIIRTRTAQTTVIIKDGETLVIGGLIDDSDAKGVSKVPLLGDIPILGQFFRSNTFKKARNELLIFVTPRIIRD
ncbi:MAG: type IV pilus secretin PilQ [Elusimicrobiota bacterium]